MACVHRSGDFISLLEVIQAPPNHVWHETQILGVRSKLISKNQKPGGRSGKYIYIYIELGKIIHSPPLGLSFTYHELEQPGKISIFDP